MMHCKFTIALFIQFLLFKQLLAADPPVTYLGIEQGLSNNSVRCIYQDHNGFMWFGTYDGLNRYDGYEFKVFRNKLGDTTSLPHNFIYTVKEDHANNLWVGTGQGIGIYNNLTAQFLPAYFFSNETKQKEKISCHVNVLDTDAQGNVFIGTNGWGLMIRYKNAGKAVQIPIIRNGRQTFTYSVSAIKIDLKQRIWLFIDLSLCIYDPVSQQIRVVHKNMPGAFCLETDDQENVWIGTGNGLYKYHILSNSLVLSYNEESGMLSSNHVVSLCFDKQRRLWIGTEGGGINILDFQTGKIQYLLPGENKNALSSEAAFSIFEDKEGRKWVGTLKGGINIIDPQKARFQTIAHDPLNPVSLVNNFVSSFLEDREGNLWIGTDGGGMSIWNRKQHVFRNFRHQAGNAHSLSHNQVSSICQDYLGDIWMATFGGGINKYNKANHTFEHFACINDVSGEENKNVWLLYEDAGKTLWATTFSSGRLYRLNRLQKRFEVFEQKLNDLIALTEDKNGFLWAGNSHQLIKLDKQNKKYQYFEIGKPVRAIYEDKKGNLWIGAEGGGLILFDPKQGKIKTRFSDVDGLCNNAVLNILEDNKGYLWLSTFNGLSRFSPAEKTFKNFYQDDGLQSNQFLYNAALQLQSGELIFGGIKGFNIFNPDSVLFLRSNPPVLITGLRINNLPVAGNNRRYITATNGDRIDALRIPFNDAVLSFDFAALEYSAPGKIQYAYFMDGWDKDWYYAGKNRTGNYSKLHEGNYVLHIKSTSAAGVWNPREVCLRITVLPPWYRTWWAYTLYLMLIGAAIYLYQQYRLRQSKLEYEVSLAKLNAAKERAERNTEKVIIEKEREINEKRESFFTSISHEFRTPLTLIINPIKDLVDSNQQNPKEHYVLNIVYHNARRLLSLVDQLLLFRKAESDADKLKLSRINCYSLCKDVYLAFVLKAKANGIEYRFECGNEALTVYGDREKMEIILYNLLSNALKYTQQNGSITFSIKETDENIIITVQDNGIMEIPKEVGDKLFDKFYQVTSSKTGFGIGLYLVKHFVEAHKGSLSYTSEADKGTTFIVTLLKGTTHFGDLQMVLSASDEPGFLEELAEGMPVPEVDADLMNTDLDTLTTESHSILVVDDDVHIKHYIAQIFKEQYKVYEAGSGEEGLKLARQYQPDIIISDVVMQNMNGIELCKAIKEDNALNHVPVILLTGTSSSQTKLKGVEGGADDYITKPFEKELLIARVSALLKSRSNLQKYFYNEITLQHNTLKISSEYKAFLDSCMSIVEQHLEDETFSIRTLAMALGMSYAKMHKKVKAISGQPANAFIRFIRLRKAAELFINTNHNVNEVMFQVGFNDKKYFREHFNKLFGMNPSEYIKKYRNVFGKNYQVNEKIFKGKNKDIV